MIYMVAHRMWMDLQKQGTFSEHMSGLLMFSYQISLLQVVSTLIN